MSPPEADAAELPSSPGARLRSEREAQGISHQQAAESLNLDTMVLAHLEANDFAALGAPVFVKGHLRRYTTMLGLDEDEIVALYEHSKQQLGEPSLVPNSRLEMAPVRGKPRWPWVVGGAATLFIASALVAYLSEHGLPWVDQIPEESVATPVLQEAPAATTQAPVPTTQAPAAAASAPSIAGPAGIASDATAATTSSALQSGQVSLSVKFTADSWIEVFDGSGKAVLYDLGKGGTERTLTATAPLSVTIGDGAAVVVTVNGRVLPVLPRAQGQALARFSIGPDGSLR
jgi:cytoskeleton protein RodZ